MDEVIVRLERVEKRFDAIRAVDGVSFTVRRGEFVTLLGPSGCGKSTILRMIAGFEDPDAGHIEIDGIDVRDQPAHHRPVNMVFQSYALFPHLNVFDNVAFGLRRKKIASAEVEQRVKDYLHLVSLDNLDERYPSQLSGGQQQRVALARALVNRPKLLLLDEPLGALDLKLRRRMQVELKQLQRELQISFVYVTHDQDEALTLSDRIAVMNNGHILQVGRGREIYDRPQSLFVANFLGEANVLSGNVVSESGRFKAEIGGCLMPLGNVINPPVESGGVLFAIRPEHVRLSTEADVRKMRCLVEDKLFLGNGLVVYARNAARQLITVRNSDRALFDQLTPGQTVYVDWHSDDCSVLSE
ncbi:MAG TPA: ABC transporter ATP-binding protein [Stellaceae bacterium]|nr:ABC transporter ATP-binding protein [Stellaceae bacterium]